MQLYNFLVNASRWEEHVELYQDSSEQASTSKPVTNTSLLQMKQKSSSEDTFLKKFTKSGEQTYRNTGSSLPMFVDPNIQVKIADLGNACWEVKFLYNIYIRFVTIG